MALTGLHLDVVRMSRGIRKEVRELGEGELGELIKLRQEVRLWREENEILRRRLGLL